MDAAADHSEEQNVSPRGSTRTERWARAILEGVLAEAGIELNGDEPWSPQIRHPRALTRFVLGGTLGVGEGYVDGDWDCDALDVLVERVCRASLDDRIARPIAVAAEALAHAANFQTARRAKENIAAHYNLGVDLYEAMLGRTLAYSCGYWRNAQTLDEAQDAKHDLICRKIGLEPGMRVLDIGCGFGAFARYAAERRGVSVTGVTISVPQAERAKKNCAGLPIDIEVLDYRDLEKKGRFDRVVSIGMFEHVGPLNHRTFFDVVRRALIDDGLALVQTIGTTKASWRTDPWINRYIFPHAVIPAASQITAALEGRLHVEDWHAFGDDYDRTLMAWSKNFEKSWPRLSEEYTERFRRLWRYYLHSCAGTFRGRRTHLWQIVLSKNGAPRACARAA